MSILSAKPSTPQQKIKLVADLGVEYEGWCITFLNHLRDEENWYFRYFYRSADVIGGRILKRFVNHPSFDTLLRSGESRV